MSVREETPGQTQNPLEGLLISSGLATPRNPPGRAGKPVYFWPLMGFCLLVLLSAGFLLVIDVWRNRRNSGTNIRGKTDETVMELSNRNENWTPASQQEENDYENL